jgi:hypothetical protein
LFVGESFVASFAFIAAGVMGMHYECLQNVFGQCPTPFAVGENDTGKTTTGKFFLSIVGRQAMVWHAILLKQLLSIHHQPYHLSLMILII